MLSQVAWKIGRSFSAGRENSLNDFQVVEVEISGLAKALKLLAEALHAESDDSLVQIAEKTIQEGISSILASCKRIVGDLESLVDQYQVIRKHRTVGGFAIERTWSDVVMAEYKTMIWTTEGGNIYDLKDLLQLHTIYITLMMQALQR